MSPQTIGYILLGAAAVIIVLLCCLLSRIKTDRQKETDLTAELTRLQSELERSVQGDILTLGKYLMESQQTHR